MIQVYHFKDERPGELFDVYIELPGVLVGSVAALRDLQRQINEQFDNAVHSYETQQALK